MESLYTSLKTEDLFNKDE
uniref:Uncharacterized protein n=1 Tax=Lepeophtheirus salmonis TaxID=72036 RepID=A0A0K2VKR9_LEPSM